METEVSSVLTTSLRSQVKSALFATRVGEQYPEMAKAILRWYAKDLGDNELAELKHNGAGKQVVLKYTSAAFMDIIMFANKVAVERYNYTPEQKQEAGRLLIATCLFNHNNVGTLLGVSRSTVLKWSAARPDKFPMQRLGGEISTEALNLILGWWQLLVARPGLMPEGRLLTQAHGRGASWPVIARLTGQTVQQAKRAAVLTEENAVVVNVHVNSTAEAGHPAEPARSAGFRAEGHLAGGSEDRPELHHPDEPSESLLREAAPVAGDDPAFAPAVYLASDDEADDGDAGHADAPEDGVPAGDEGREREGTGSTERGVHPFLLA